MPNCLEVLFEDDETFFTLCLNPVLCFDVYLRKKDLDVSAKIARAYVTNTQLTVHYGNDKIAPEVEYSKTVNNSAFKLCKHGMQCRIYKCGEFLFADLIYLKYQYPYNVSHRFIK